MTVLSPVAESSFVRLHAMSIAMPLASLCEARVDVLQRRRLLCREHSQNSSPHSKLPTPPCSGAMISLHFKSTCCGWASPARRALLQKGTAPVSGEPLESQHGASHSQLRHPAQPLQTLPRCNPPQNPSPGSESLGYPAAHDPAPPPPSSPPPTSSTSLSLLELVLGMIHVCGGLDGFVDLEDEAAAGLAELPRGHARAPRTAPPPARGAPPPRAAPPPGPPPWSAPAGFSGASRAAGPGPFAAPRLHPRRGARATCAGAVAGSAVETPGGRTRALASASASAFVKAEKKGFLDSGDLGCSLEIPAYCVAYGNCFCRAIDACHDHGHDPLGVHLNFHHDMDDRPYHALSHSRGDHRNADHVVLLGHHSDRHHPRSLAFLLATISTPLIHVRSRIRALSGTFLDREKTCTSWFCTSAHVRDRPYGHPF
eukprot:CAMPEP_0114301104 /NCGR_PEP_ID=MMETSP0059-20121206/13923_1 /TAXON_ID=36894 /ORGANISM="Pyramimonas parkeae, Strain CCMP726" /LENGTH=426 /DNA_ID=CAMNT_0001423809 /DNA_START=1484 /DNA_END=2764 /DNA_ORIENTATION=-